MTSNYNIVQRDALSVNYELADAVRYVNSETISAVKVKASDAEAYAYFGANSNETANGGSVNNSNLQFSDNGLVCIVGAVFDDPANYGAVYVFTRSTTSSPWVETQKLTASDKVADDRFGYAASLNEDGSIIVVGSHLDDGAGSNQGSAYIFTKSGSAWVQTQKIINSDAAAGDSFGRCVKISNNSEVLIVGAPGADILGSGQIGAAYIFTKSGTAYVEAQKIKSGDGLANEEFGHSVTCTTSGDTIFIGTPFDNGLSAGIGAIYMFTKTGSATWTQTQKITGPTVAAWFGSSIDVTPDGQTLVGGAWYQDAIGVDSGAAYIFSKSGTGYILTQTIYNASIAAYSYFGTKVAITNDGSIIAVCALDTNTYTDDGTVYLFEKNSDGWYDQTRIIKSSDGGAASDWFGSELDIWKSGNTIEICVGYHDDTTAVDSGAVDFITIQKSTSQTVYSANPISKYDLVGKNGEPYSLATSATSALKIVSPVTGANQAFGASIFLTKDGQYMFVGAPGVYNTAVYGKVYIYSKSGSGWHHIQTLQAPTPLNKDMYGVNITGSYDGKEIAVTAFNNPSLSVALGSYVYMYTKEGSGWSYKQKLVHSNEGAGTNSEYNGTYGINGFGIHAVMNDAGTEIALPNACRDDADTNNGAVYMFSKSGTAWVETQKLQPRTTQASQYFGRGISLSADGKTLFVGAYGSDTGGEPDSGSIYVFTKTNLGWIHESAIVASTPIRYNYFSTHIALNADASLAVCSAHGYVNSTGAIYVFAPSVSGFVSWGGYGFTHKWQEKQFITAYDGAVGYTYGLWCKLSNSGNLLAVNAYNYNAVGAIYLYKFNRTTKQYVFYRKLVASDYQTNAVFGAYVQIADDENLVVCGSPYDDNSNGVDAGAVYIHKLNNYNTDYALGVYTGDSDPDNPNIKYIAPKNGYIYDTNHGYTVGQKVINNQGIEIGVALQDRILVKF